MPFPRFLGHRIKVFEPFSTPHKSPGSRSLALSVDAVDYKSARRNRRYLHEPHHAFDSGSDALARSLSLRRSFPLRSCPSDPPAASVYSLPNEPMHRMPGTLYGDPVTDSVFVIDIAVPKNPDEFTVKLAPVLVNGKHVDIPAVTFLRRSSVSFPAQVM
jgi:hypothetical protein